MFLMTSMLLGLLAVGIPVAIHLLHRQRTTPVQWGAMQFLVESPLQQKRRKKVDHWLLMLLRAAAIALLVLALSRPLLIDGKYSPLSNNLATDVAVVLDRSLSTARRSGDTSGLRPRRGGGRRPRQGDAAQRHAQRRPRRAPPAGAVRPPRPGPRRRGAGQAQGDGPGPVRRQHPRRRRRRPASWWRAGATRAR
jgi:hypothetical protein